MYHKLRQWHRVIGVLNALFLMILSGTGFLLALKNSTNWIRPEEKKGAEIKSSDEVIPVAQAMKSAFGAGIATLTETSDIDRVDYRPKRNVFKVVAKENYHEVQVCGKTGNVLQVAQRTDQFTENIHDLSIFHPKARDVVLPFIALSLFALSTSGVCIYSVPILRRRKNADKIAAALAAKRNKDVV